MVDIILPQPKHSPLRPLPALNKRSQSLVCKTVNEHRIVLQEEELVLSVEVQSGVSASLVIQSGQDLESASVHIRAVCKKDAHLDCDIDIENGKRIAVSAQYDLQGSGSSADVSAVFHGTRNAQHSMSIVMHHQSTDTKGNIAIRGVYEQTAKGLFSGLIKVTPHAQKTNSYFRDDILLLDEATAESLPTLEIEAHDVKASHGSTTSRLNEDQLFYLQSRGLDRAQSRSLIIDGFLGKVSPE